MQLNQQQLQLASNKAIMQAMAESDGTFEGMMKAAKNHPDILPNDYFGMVQHAQQAYSTRLAQTESELKIADANTERMASLLTPNGNPVDSVDKFNAAKLQGSKMGVPLELFPQSYPPGGPDDIKSWVNSHRLIKTIKAEDLQAAQTRKEEAATQTEQLTQQVKTQEIAKGATEALARDIQLADTDPKNPALPSTAAWKTILDNAQAGKYGKGVTLPAIPSTSDIARLTRTTVPVEKQPQYDVERLQRDLYQTLATNPQALQARVDASIDRTKYPELNAIAFNEAKNAGDYKGINAAIEKYAATVAEIEKETNPNVRAARVAQAEAMARATNPFKIQLAAQTAVAKADAAGLTDDDYQRAGEQYGRTGIMPAMGRDSMTRARIEHAKNEWARDNGFTPGDLVAMQAAYAGDKESLKKFQTQRDQIVSFEQTAQKNLDLFLREAAKIPDTGMPWLNTPLRSLNQSVVGSENMAAVNAARQIANNEIAKVTSGGGLGGVLSDSARHEVEAYNPQNATFKQTVRVAQILKQDMANRHQSMDATLSDIKTRIGGGGGTGATTTPNTQEYTKYGKNPKTGHRIGLGKDNKWHDVETGAVIQ